MECKVIIPSPANVILITDKAIRIIQICIHNR
jgi:hypothetical protein